MAAQKGGGLPGRPKSKGAVPAFRLGEEKPFNIIRWILGRPAFRQDQLRKSCALVSELRRFERSRAQITGEGADPQRWLYPVKVDTMDFELAQRSQSCCRHFPFHQADFRDDAIRSRVLVWRIGNAGVERHFVPTRNGVFPHSSSDVVTDECRRPD